MMRPAQRFLTVVVMASFLGSNAQATTGQSDGDAAIQLSGFSVSQAYDIVADQPLDLADSKFLKLLFRSEKISAVNYRKWAAFSSGVTWPQLIQSPDQFRFWTFDRKLVLTRLTQVRFPDRVATEALKGFYLARCKNSFGQTVFLATKSAPRKIVLNQPIEQPVSFSGFYYNTVAVGPNGDPQLSYNRDRDDDTRGRAGQGGGGLAKPISEGGAKANVSPVFVAKRFAWHPIAATPDMDVSSGQLALAKHGFDAGLFDDVRRQNSKPLSGVDADAFYQMLAAVKSISADSRNENGDPSVSQDSRNSTIQQTDFFQLMSAPTQHFGGAVSVAGRLRQCVPIKITDPDRQRQVGEQQYFQVSLFPDLNGRDVVVRTAGDHSVSFNQFPVTICLPKLPPGVTPQTLEGRTVEVEGYFYRFIKYQSKISTDAELTGQVSPLVMVSEIRMGTAGRSAQEVDVLMRGLLLLVLAVVIAGIVWGLVKDRALAGRQIAIRDDTLPEKIEFSDFQDQIDE
jgi:hypothetical protein